MSFLDPIVGGTVLRIPAIQSPDFSLSDQTGWAILQNGDAYFFNITAVGTITGGSLIIDGANGGVFVYSGTPAHGNLIVSLAGAAGTDAQGNAYPEGISVTAGTIAGTSITGSTFAGTDFLINTAGLFFYSGTPAAGNLIISIARIAGTDGFGNAYPQGWAIGAAGTSKQVVGGVISGSPLIYWLSAISTALNNAAAMLSVHGAGTAAFDSLIIKSSQDTTHTDYVAMNLDGNSNDGTTHFTNLSLAYVDTSGTAHFHLLVSSTGLAFPVGAAVGAGTAPTLTQGELFMANAAAAPATPTAGGALYAASSVPHWKDAGGLVLGMVRSYYEASTSNLASFTAETAVPGASVNVVVTGASATVKIWAHFDFQTATSAATMVGKLKWNGTDQTEQAIFVSTAVLQRANVGQGWEITGVAAGTYTAALYATCSSSGAQNAVESPHTTISVLVIDT